MAVATLSAGVSERRIAAAREKAVALVAAAWQPQPIRQADGTVRELCWAGRVARAVQLANEASAAGERGRLEQINAALVRLSAGAGAAAAAAQRAVADYAALCAAAGREVENLYPAEECSCEGCKLRGRITDLSAAEAGVRAAAWALLGPDIDARPERPQLTALLARADDKAVRDRIWLRLKAFADACEEYAAACARWGDEPDWGNVWR